MGAKSALMISPASAQALADAPGWPVVAERPVPFACHGEAAGQREQLHILLLDAHGHCLTHLYAAGHRDGVALDMRQLATAILGCGCRYLLMSHNHPSGDPTPSAQDVRASRGVAALARILGAELLDHEIMAGPRMFSFRAEGLI
jgi:DNA repair protein RadC